MTTPEQTYLERIERFSSERDHLQRRSDRNGNISLGLIGAALLCGLLWLWQGIPLALPAALALAAGFVVSFSIHGGVNAALRRARELVAVNQEGVARLKREWANIPLHDPAPADSAHPYADDLDIVGRASLEHLLHTPTTPVGRATLRGWLLAPATPENIRARQAAVAELAPQLELREQLALAGRAIGGDQRTYEGFVAWAESPPWLLPKPWLIWLSRALGVVATLLLLVRLVGVPPAIPLVVVGVALGAALVANLIVLGFTLRTSEALIEQVTQRQQVFAGYAALFELLAQARFESAELRRLQTVLRAGNRQAGQQMRRLARLMPVAEVRKWMFFFPIQIATLWNLHVLWALERWRAKAGASTRPWLAALGETEALLALATLAYDNPEWAMPAPGSTPRLVAKRLGHPLIAPGARVDNDVELGPPGHLLLVTGSNMSGKSTLLRSIGLNVVLAQAGGPACASALELGMFDLTTSMRVRDSLDEGVSYFMAELRRLKFVVDRAELTRQGGERTALFLLDEILHGTNSAERLIAARAILRHLLDAGATGAVSTHDLALAEAPELVADSTLVHFREQFQPDATGTPQMRFDYTLRPGIAQTTNALALVRQLLGPEFAHTTR